MIANALYTSFSAFGSFARLRQDSKPRSGSYLCEFHSKETRSYALTLTLSVLVITDIHLAPSLSDTGISRETASVNMSCLSDLA